MSLLQNTVSFIIGLFAKEPYDFKEPTNCSHPISAAKLDICKRLLSEDMPAADMGWLRVVGSLKL